MPWRQRIQRGQRTPGGGRIGRLELGIELRQ
jgi:hypothetical protein